MLEGFKSESNLMSITFQLPWYAKVDEELVHTGQGSGSCMQLWREVIPVLALAAMYTCLIS